MEKGKRVILRILGEDGSRRNVRAVLLDGEEPEEGRDNQHDEEEVETCYWVCAHCLDAFKMYSKLCGLTEAALVGLLMGIVTERDNVSAEDAEHYVLLGRKSYRHAREKSPKH